MSVSDETPTLDKSSSENSTTPKGKKRIDVAVAFVLCGALFSLLIFLYMFKQERDTAIQGFHVQIAQDTARFEQRLAYSFYNVASLQAYLDLSPQMAGMDLSAVASRIVNPHQGVEALLWLPEGQLNPTQFSVAEGAVVTDSLDPAVVDIFNGESVTSQIVQLGGRSVIVRASGAGAQRMLALLDLDNLIKTTLLNSVENELVVHLFTAAAEANGPVYSLGQGTVAEDSITDKTITLLDGSELTLSFAATESYLAGEMNYTSLFFLLTGLLLSFLLASYLKRLSQHLKRLKDEQDIMSEQMIDTSWNDPLTGLVNRTHFDEALDIECRRAVREFSPLSMILLRIDDFAQYSEHYGVDAADILVQRISETLKSCVSRPGDILARVDESQFGFILPSTNELVVQLAERCSLAVRTLALPNESEAKDLCVTVSLGVVTLQPTRLLTAERLFDTTMQQLEQAREAGGDQYNAYIENSTEPSLTYSV
jgi:diguanylate cyclase (GGDEF)-like protein